MFKFIGGEGNIDRAEMYQVFNMGIGMAVIVGEPDATKAKRVLRAHVIGRIERGTGKTILVF